MFDQKSLDIFFQGDATCNTTCIYLNQQICQRKEIQVKHIENDDGNNPFRILFIKDESCHHIYSFLLLQILIWANDPRAFARQGYLGHHTTIGFKGNTLDIHDTFYDDFTDKYDYMILAKTSQRINYIVDQNNELIKTSGQESMFQEANEILWNDIKSHGYGSCKRPLCSKVIKLMNPEFFGKQTKHTLRISEIARVINERLQEAYKHLETKKYTCGVVVIPYVSKNVEKRVIQKLALNEDHVNIMFSCHDHDTRCSVICINMWND